MLNRLPAMIGALACAVLAATAFAQSGLTPREAPNTQAKPYIVQLAGDPILAYEGGVSGIAATKPGKGQKVNPNSRNYQRYQDYLESQQNEAASAVDAQAGYHYSVAFNGFSAVLTDSQVEALKARDDVVAVYEDELLQPHTNSTPNFLNLTNGSDSWSKGYVGEDVIIGVVDSGIQGDHPSFADVPTPKKGNKGPNIPYDAPPADWFGSGCDLGGIPCSNKLLKAEAFNASFQTFATSGPVAGELFTAQDTDGHGSHTASTAGGNWGVPAEVNGVSFGTVSGMAPRARVAAYKVCYDAADPNESGCYSSDSMAAIDQAVADGVDVINFSIGGSSNNFTGPDDIAFLFAADAGVWVATSNGNAGPNRGTTGTPSGVPWITAVGATEDDENFGTALEVQSPASLAGDYEGLEANSTVTLADTGDIVAEVESADPLNACTPLSNDLTGKIALAIRGACSFSQKFNMAAAAGADAIVVYNDGTGLEDRIFPIVMFAPGTTIPGIMISFFDGVTLNDANTLGETIVGRLSPDIAIARVDRVAGFSSRGPNNGALDIIKPDIAAPGVGILAGETLIPNASAGGGQFFAFLSGTSMASPHAAGTFALLKQAHPDWSAAQAKSALMTTARQNLLQTFGDTPASPFDIGAGLIQPNETFDPGLTYDAGFLDYLAFMCFEPAQVPLTSPADCQFLADNGFATDSADLNLASIGIGALAGNQTVTRTVTSVAPGNRKFLPVVEAPPGIDVSVSPSVIQIRQGESASYEVTFTVTGAATLDEWAFGSLTWTDHDGRYHVRSPIAVRPVAINAPEEVEGDGTDGSLDFDVTFGYSGPYQVDMEGLFEGVPFAGAVADGDADLYFFTVPAGTDVTRIALFDEDVGAGDGSDDLDMQVFGPESAGFPFLGSSGSPTSEEEFNIVNPEGGGTYAFFVIDFASAPGPTPYTAWVFNQDGTDQGNTTLTAPASATVATTGTITLDWFGLTAGTRNLGTIVHSDGSDEIAETEVMIDAQ